MKRLAVTFLLILTASPLIGQGEVLSLRTLPSLVLAKDPGVSSSEQSALLALHTYQGTVAQAFPQINFTNSYGVDYLPTIQSQQSFTLQNGQSQSLDTTINDEMNHSLITSLSLSQLLPTAGSLSLSVNNTMTVSDLGSVSLSPDLPGITKPFTTPQFNQLPSVSVRLDQPLFLNGKIMDFDLFPATFRKARIGYEKAELARRAQTNQAITQSSQLFLSIVQLRKNIDQTEKALAVVQGNLDTLQKNFALGSVTEADLLDSKISLATQKQGLLQMRANLAKAEKSLAHSIGRESLSGLVLDDSIPALDLAMSRDEVMSRALANQPLILKQSLAVEESRVDDTLSGQRYASNFSLSFSFSPRYPYVNPSTPLDMDFQTSFKHLFADNWSQDYKVSANLTLHLFDGGQSGETRAANAAMTRMAEDSLLSQKQTIQDQADLDLAQKDTLQDKVSLLTDAVSLSQKRLDTETALLALGKSTRLNVDSRRADFLSKQNDLWRAKADLMLTILDLASLSGADLAKLIAGEGKTQ